MEVDIINNNMNDFNDYQMVMDVLRNKIEMEEETLQLLVRTGLLAEDQVVHYQMICTQQQILIYYRELLDKVGINTNRH